VKIVAISGKMGSGKTTLAKHIQSKDARVRLIHFATPLKDAIIAMGIPREDVEVTKPAVVRQLMQVYGQAMRHYDPDYWVRKVQRKLEDISWADARTGADTVVVVDDVRFPNELAMLEAYGAVTVRLAKFGDPNGPSPHDDDVSETALDSAEFNIPWAGAHGYAKVMCADVCRALEKAGVVDG